MKKLFVIFLSAIMVLLAGCGQDAGNSTSSEGSVQSEASEYEYTYRELSETKYREPASAFAGGNGSESDPYQISNAEELAFMQNAVSDDALNNTYKSACYVLTADIALNDVSGWENWSENAPEYSWKPIDGFDGVFDGNGHKISGMYINTNCGTEGEYSTEAYGLFGKTMDGTVKNLTVDSSYIAVSGNTTHVGGIAGELFYEGKIENCTSVVTIDCYDGAYGGIAGVVTGGGSSVFENEDVRKFSEIINCIFEGEINQVKEGSLSYLGGIAGTGDGNITDCENKGTLNFGGNDVDTVGGIIAFWGEGVIDNCVNSGNINCKSDEEGALANAGGIVGNLFVSATGSEKYMSRGATVKNCVNEGYVSAGYYAGGIAGNINNDHNDWCINIVGNINKGKVESQKYTGGIAGALYCSGDAVNGDNVVIDNCVNESDISVKGDCGGILGFFQNEKGNVVIKNCENNGAISAENQNSAGIIAYWLPDSAYGDFKVNVENCKNNGKIESKLNAGGIFSFAAAVVVLEQHGNGEIAVSGCVNNGEIITVADNAYVGGISGCWGMQGIKTRFDACVNNGKLSINNSVPSDETLNSAETYQLSRIAGGIIGRVGGLLASTGNEAPDDSFVQKPDADITLTDCVNRGELFVNVSEEYKAPDGDLIYKNYFGGIIGNTVGKEGYSIFADDCEYANFERGLGDSELTDIGTKK